MPTPEEIRLLEIESKLITLESKVQQLIFINRKEVNVFSKYRELIEAITKEPMSFDNVVDCHERALKIIKDKI